MLGRGPRGNNSTCSALCWLSVSSSATHNQIGPFWCCFLSGWICVCSRTLQVSRRNSPVRLGVCLTATSNPTGVFNQWFEALFPCTGALGYTPQGSVGLQLFPLVYLHSSVGLPAPPGTALLSPPAAALPTPLHNPPPRWFRLLPSRLSQSSSHRLAGSPPHPATNLHPFYHSG